MSPQSDCPCMRRTGSDSNCSSASASSSTSTQRRLSRSAGSVRVFPATEPEDYCRPTLSVNTKLDETQRLAVLLDQNLWKPDGESVECDTLGCGTRFTLFERKHHCRKCGGIFCNACSSKTIPLLDTSRMPFVIPPANVPLPLLTVSSPTGALVPSRVCTDCYALLTGAVPPSIERVRSASASALPTTSSSPRLRAAKASTDNVPGLSNSPSGSSSQNGYAHSNTSGSAMYYPCGTTFVVKPRHLRRSRTTSSNTSGRTASPVIPRRDSLNTARSASPSVLAQSRASPFPQPPTPITPAAAADYTSLGVLAEYPLKVPSKGCKESGGAFWVPKPLPRRMDSPIRYEAPSPRRTPERHVSEIDEDVEEADEGAPPVVPIRRTIARSTFEVSIEKAPFGCPAHAREPDHVSNF